MHIYSDMGKISFKIELPPKEHMHYQQQIIRVLNVQHLVSDIHILWIISTGRKETIITGE